MTTGLCLDWEGKRPAAIPDPAPALEQISQFEGAELEPSGNRLIQGDNLAVMAALLPEYTGKLNLIYLDPPFFTGKEWFIQSPAGTRRNSLAYDDVWSNDIGLYLQWLYDRLSCARRLLSDTGVIYLHLNWQAAHYAKLLMDEIFGIEQFQNDIIWCYREAINSKVRWNRKHDNILFYSKTANFTFNSSEVLQPYSENTVKKFRNRDDKGPYRLMGRGITDSPLRSKRDIPAQMESLFPELTYRHYLGEGTLPVDYWNIDIENQASAKRTGYPTQKPEELLERILLASSNPGDLVADFCCGSGTTAAVAHKLGRTWIACDVGAQSLGICTARMTALSANFTLERTASD